jgi:uncharacterized protein (DUF1015 family)
MITVKPFRGLRPKESLAEQIASPPYDVLSSDEARQLAENNPRSFLHVNKPEIDLPADVDPYSETVYQKGRDTLQQFIQNGWLVQEEDEAIYIYRLTWRGHTQTGYVLLSSVNDYDEGRIKKHEYTRPQKEKDRTDLIDTMNAQVGSVFLMYLSNPVLDGLLEQATRNDANVDFKTPDGVHHQLWVVVDPKVVAKIVSVFGDMEATYIADGHHRSAAASNVCKRRREQNPDASEDEPFHFFLSVVFPHNQLKILPYNRVIRDLNGLEPDAFLKRLQESFEVDLLTGEPVIDREHEFGMYLQSSWYRLRPKPGTYDEQDTLDRLDVNILMKTVLDPILGIQNPRTDPRIDFVGGIRGHQELMKRVDSGSDTVAFCLYPTQINALIDVADAGEVMPPKSTWFEPKLRSGMVSHLL